MKKPEGNTTEVLQDSGDSKLKTKFSVIDTEYRSKQSLTQS